MSEQTPETVKQETAPKPGGDKREEEIAHIVAQYRAKHPNAQLFLIDLKGDDRIFIAKLGSFKAMAKFAKQIQDAKADFSEPMINMVQKHLVHPELTYEQLADGPDVEGGLKSGHVVVIANKMQEANGFEDEAELKKL